jgi:hypothetical protein
MFEILYQKLGFEWVNILFYIFYKFPYTINRK